MRTIARFVLFTLALGFGGVGCKAQIRGTATVTAPELVLVEGDVWVVERYHEPVFYTEGFYWRFYGGVWYRSTVHTGNWVTVTVVPASVQRIDKPDVYVNYAAPAGATKRTGPPDHAPAHGVRGTQPGHAEGGPHAGGPPEHAGPPPFAGGPAKDEKGPPPGAGGPPPHAGGPVKDEKGPPPGAGGPAKDEKGPPPKEDKKPEKAGGPVGGPAKEAKPADKGPAKEAKPADKGPAKEAKPADKGPAKEEKPAAKAGGEEKKADEKKAGGDKGGAPAPKGADEKKGGKK